MTQPPASPIAIRHALCAKFPFFYDEPLEIDPFDQLHDQEVHPTRDEGIECRDDVFMPHPAGQRRGVPCRNAACEAIQRYGGETLLQIAR